MKRILVLTESIKVNDSSGAQANVALIRNLVKLKHSLKVYHLDNFNPKIERVETTAIKRYNISLYYWLARFKTLFSKLGLNFNPFVEKTYGFSFSHFEDVERFKKALAKEIPEKYDMVLTLSKAASFRPHKAVLESPKWHAKWYAYVHDPYPMYVYPRPYDWAEPGAFIKKQFFQKVYNHSRFMVYPSQMLAEWMESYYSGGVKKRLIIPHQIDQNLSSIINKVIHLQDFFNSSKFTILHAGSLMKQRPPFVLVKAFNRFLEQSPEAKSDASLIFIGRSDKDHNQKMDQLGNSNIINYNQYLQFETAFELQKQASVNVVIEANTWLSPFLPGKIPHLVKANKPILHIGPQQSETMRLLGEDYPLHAPNHPDHIELLSEKIARAYKNWTEKKELNLNRKDLEKYLSTIEL